MAIVDEDENPVFVYTLPSSTGSIMILSSPELKTGIDYEVWSNVSVDGGTQFHGLYTSLPTITDDGSESVSFSTTSSSYVYTDSSAGTNGGPQEGSRPNSPRF